MSVVVVLLAGGGVLLREAMRNALDARRKTSFVSNVSHELKTPLTTIRMYADLLRDDRLAGDAERRRALEVIAAESERLARLIGNVLDFSRLEEGRRRYRVEEFDVAAAVREIVGRESVRFRESGLRGEIHLPAGDAIARFDRDALGQTLLNLLDNALKYARDGGEVRVALASEGGRWRRDVEDRGPGIPPSHKNRVFEKFHRVVNR